MAGLTHDLFKLVYRIAETPSANITHQNLRRLGCQDIDKLVSYGALKQAPHLQNIDVVIDDEERSYSVQHHNGKPAYFSSKSGWVSINNEDLLVYQIDFDWLLRIVKNGLNIPIHSEVQNILDDKIWFLGSAQLQDINTPVILCRLTSNKDVSKSLYNYLRDKHSTNPALVLSLSNEIPDSLKFIGQHQIILMQDALDVESPSFAFDMAYLARKFSLSEKKFGFSNSYRTLKTRKGQVFTFSKKKASVLEIMDNEDKPMHQHEIMALSDSKQDRLVDLFRNDPSWKIIFKTDKNGVYWLDY